MASLPWRESGAIALFFLACLLIWLRAGEITETFGRTTRIVDFHAFYLSGYLANEGLIANAYKISTLLQAQWSMLNTVSFMPWTYPPPFNLLVGLLARLPIGSAYLLFVGVTFLSFVAALLALAPRHISSFLLIAFPAIVIMIICGQNGFLTAAIIGLFAFLHLRGSRYAGAVLGLMIIKPHLAIGVGIWLLCRREFAQLFQAAFVAAALCALATLVYGPSVWSYFLAATADAGWSLRMGLYPLFRMTSVYAGLLSAGLPYGAAMGAHLTIAAAMIAAIVVYALRGRDVRRSLGFAIFGSLFISPYCYDYDMPMLAIALALMWRPAFGGLFGLGILLFSWLAGASGFISRPIILSDAYEAEPLSIGWIALMSLAFFVLTLVGRDLAARRAEPVTSGAEAPMPAR